MAHAYTLSSFLSRRNMRPDEYGRTLENRLRLPSEVLTAVRGAVGVDFPVGIRFLAEECIKDGATVEETKLTARRFAELGADWLSLSHGGKFEDAVVKPGEPLYPYTGYSGDRCMPGRQYPDGANLASAAEIRAYLRQHGLTTPVVATGKIHGFEFAEGVLRSGLADFVGMARPLLADPDLPRKWREGREDKVVECVYANVCKNLDENFQEVRCYLWPKGARQAPRSRDLEPPKWPQGGAALRATVKNGRVELRFAQALDNEAVYGYDVLRAEGAGSGLPATDIDMPFARIATAKSAQYNDETAVSGAVYRYRVKAYDLAGNRSEPSETVTVRVPEPAAPAPTR
jgi:hypothetical protein